MVIVLTGGTGFIGQSLVKKLIEKNHTVHLLTRSPKKNTNFCKFFLWKDMDIPPEVFPQDSSFGVIHLAGEPIFQWPWTSRKKKTIYNSRVIGTKKLVETMKNLNKIPQFFICASATGIYGKQEIPIKEDSDFQYQGLFLQKVCEDWEKEALKLKKQCRTVILRLGIVLSFQGGFLKKQLKWSQWLTPFMLYKNKLWFSWIHRKDVIRLILWMIHKKHSEGIYNATTPHPFDMKVFFNKLSIHLKKKYLRIPVPLFAMKLLGGEIAKNLLLSCHVSSEKITQEGFEFQYKTLDEVFKFDPIVLKEDDRQSPNRP